MKKHKLLTYSHRAIAWKNKKNILWGALSLLGVDCLVFILPYLIKLSIDRLQNHPLPLWLPDFVRNLETGPFLISITLFYLGIAALIAYGRHWWRVFLVWSVFPWMHLLRRQFFGMVLGQHRDFFRFHKVGDLISVLTTDMENMRMTLAMGTLILLDVIFNFILFSVLLWHLAASLTVMVVPPLIASALFFFFLSKKKAFQYERVQQSMADLSARAFEIMSGVQVIKAFRKEKEIHQNFTKLNRQFKEDSLQVAKLQSFFIPGMELVLGLALCWILFYGGFQVIEGTLLLSNFVAFQIYLSHMEWPLIAMGWFIQLFRSSVAAQNRIQKIASVENPLLWLKALRRSDKEGGGRDLKINSTPPLSSPLVKGAPKERQGEGAPLFALQNVTLRYSKNHRSVFENLNLTLHEKKWIGLTGPVGSGKSSFLELLSRQRDPEEGAVFYRSQDLKTLLPDQITPSILYVPQDGFIFSRSIRYNITLGLDNSFTDQNLFQLLLDLQFDEALLKERGGLETRLGERGVNLSGGQRQRVILARALVRPRDVYLLDDLFSQVDVETENKLCGVLKKRLPPSSTVLLVSQRLSTLMQCQELLILSEKGQIEFHGTPLDGLEKSVFLKKIFSLQASLAFKERGQAQHYVS